MTLSCMNGPQLSPKVYLQLRWRRQGRHRGSHVTGRHLILGQRSPRPHSPAGRERHDT